MSLAAAGAFAPGAAADTVTQRTTLAVGDQPEAVAALGNGTVLVGNRAGNSLSVVNARTRAVVATTGRPGGTAPVALAVDRGRNRLYDLDLGSRLFVRVAGTRALLLTVRLPTSVQVQGADLPLTPRDVAVSTATNRVLVLLGAARGQGRLLVFNGDNGALVTQAKVGIDPQRVAVTGSGSRVLVTNAASDTVSVVDVGTGAVTQTVAVGDQPHGVVVWGSRVAIANRGSNDLSIGTLSGGTLSLQANRQTGIGNGPVDLTADTANSRVQRLYVASRGSGIVAVFRLSEQILGSGMVLQELVEVGGALGGLAVDPASHRVVVARPAADRVAVLSRFDPILHGFEFPNKFTFSLFAGPFTVLSTIVLPPADLSKDYGLCGGMVWAALDSFDLGLRRPASGTSPPRSGPVFDYVFQRLLDSLTNNNGQMLGRFLELQLKSDAELETISAAEIGQILPALDDGRPVPLGLVHASALEEPWKNHQVLAVGHFTRRDGERVIEIYDPNGPDAPSFVFTKQKIVTRDQAGTQVVVSRVDGTPVPVRALFSTMPAYVRKSPPW